jgi:transcriptional regulator with XRE-family HTH domain
MQDANDADIIFGMLLRKLRISQDKSQETLAFDAGLERVFISMLELGKRRPTLKTLIALSKGLQIPLSELMQKYENEYLKETGKSLYLIE